MAGDHVGRFQVDRKHLLGHQACQAFVQSHSQDADAFRAKTQRRGQHDTDSDHGHEHIRDCARLAVFDSDQPHGGAQTEQEAAREILGVVIQGTRAS